MGIRMSIGEICNRNVVCIKMNESIFQAAFLMRKFHVGDLVISNPINGKIMPIGILTDRDIVIEVLAKDIDPNSIMVKDIMSSDLTIANETDSVFDVLDLMVDTGVRRMPIVNDREGLIGIISIEDLIQQMAEQLSSISRVLYKGQEFESLLRT